MVERIPQGPRAVPEALLNEIEAAARASVEAASLPDDSRAFLAEHNVKVMKTIVQKQFESLQTHLQTDRKDLPGLAEETKRVLFKTTVTHVQDVVGASRELAERYVEAVFGYRV